MSERTILLVAPNLSTRMGGESIKALALLRQLHAVPRPSMRAGTVGSSSSGGSCGTSLAWPRLAEDAALANRMGRAARARADVAGFVWSRLARGWVGIYDQVLTKHGRPPLRS